MIKIIIQYSIFTLVGFAFLFLFSFVVEQGINEVDNMIVPCQHGTSYIQGKCRCDGTPYNGTYCSNCMCEHGICSTTPTTPFLNSDYGCRCPTQSKRFGYLCDICNTIDSECKGTCKPDFFGTKCEKICFADLDFENNNTVCNKMRNSGGKCNTCHGHGTCENGDCVCDKDWFSDDNYDCVLTCPGTPTCSGHGICQLYGSKPGCLCEDGWNGEKCDLPCPGVVETGNPCNGNGICNVDFESRSTSCECLQKFRGESCQIECPGDFVACNGHGTCDDLGVCTCDTNVKWSLPSCKCSDELTCNLKGECNAEEKCECFGHNTGDKCLECENNWHGNNCDMYCDPYLKNNVSYSEEGGFGCYGHGTCLVEDSVVQCTCNLDSTQRMVIDGALQDITSYYDSDMNCGECEPDYFPKQFVYDLYGPPEGYVAPCENKCEPASCNHNGICNHLYGIPGEKLCTCRAPHLSDDSFCTECEENWYPLDITNEKTCHRFCIASGELPDECDGSIDCVQCNGHGTCSDEGDCLCEGAYTGDQCQILCEGQNGLVCGGHGTCGSNNIQQLMEHEFRELGNIPLYSCTCDPQDPVDADSRIDWDEKLEAGLVNGTLDPPPNPEYFGETCDFSCVKPPWQNADECNGMGNCTIIPIRTPLDQTISCHTDLDCQSSLTIQQITSGDVTWSDKKGPFCHKQDDIEGCEKSTDDCYEILLKQRPRKMRSEECVTNSTCYAAIEAEDWFNYCVEVQKDLQPTLFEDCNSVISFCPAKNIPTNCKQMVDYTNGVDVSYKLNLMYEYDKKHYPFRMSEIYRTNESALLHDDAEVAFQGFDHSIDLRVDDSFCQQHALKYPTIDTVRENKQYICNGEVSNTKNCSGILDESSGVFYKPFTVVCSNFNESFTTYSEAMANRPTNCKIVETEKEHVFTTGGQEHIDTMCQSINDKFPKCTNPEPCDFNPCSQDDYTCENKGTKAICSTLNDLNSTCKVGVSERLTYSSYSCDIVIPDTSCPNEITHYTNLAQHCKDNNPILSSIPLITNDDTIAIVPGKYIHFHFRATDEITTGTRLEIGDAVRIYVRQGQIQLNEAETLQACPITTPECNNIWAYNADTWYYLELKFNTTHVTMKRKDTGASITKPLLSTNPMIYVTTIPGSSVVEYRDIYSENDIASPFTCAYDTCDLDVSYREICSDIIRNIEYPTLLEPKYDPLTTCSNYFENSRIPVNEPYEVMEDIYALNWTAYCAFYTDLVGTSSVSYESLEGYTECQEFVDPLDGDKTCIDNALSYNWETSCQELLEARIPQNLKDACPKQCYNHLLSYNDCDDMFELFSSDKQVIDKCSMDWYDYCLQDSKGTLQGTCSAVECSCDYETYEGISGQACELHCPVASDSTACAEGSNLGKCVYTAAQKEKLKQPGFLFRDIWALEGECQCFGSEGSRSCDIKCFQCNNETYNGGQIGICDNTRGTCDCLPPFVEIESYTEVNWRGKNTTKIERVYNTGNVTGADLFRIRMMQGKESFTKNALEISSGVLAYDGTQDWETLFFDFVDNPTNYYCFDKQCDYGHSTLASNLDGTSSRFNFDCSSTCPGTDETTRIPCSGRGVCGENGQCVCDPANVIVGQDESGFKRVYQVFPGVEVTDSKIEISSLDRTGYRGDGCEKTCRGYDEDLKDMSTICSGHGKCDLSGECACELGYLGTDCEFKCPGFEEGDDNVCNGHGTCQFASFKYSDNMFPGVVQKCKYYASKTNCMLYAELQGVEFTQESKLVTASVSYEDETILTMDSEKCINRIELATIKKDCSDIPPDHSECSAQVCETGLITYTRNCDQCGCDPGDILERNCSVCGSVTLDSYLMFNVTEVPILFPNGTQMVYQGEPVVENVITNYTVNVTQCNTCFVYKDCATCKTCYKTGDINCVCSYCGTSTIPDTVTIKFNNIEETFDVVNNTIQTKPICTDQLTVEFPQNTNATITLFEVPSDDGMCVSPGRWEFYNESAEKVCITKAASNLDDKVQYSLLTGLKEYSENCTNGYYDIMTGQCQEADLKPMIKTWFYSDIGTFYEQRVETTCIVLPGKNIECAICDCFSDSTVGFWGNVLCNTCLKGFGNEQCLKECPGGAATMCNGHGSCLYGSILEQELFQPADCVCADVSKPTGGSCTVTEETISFVYNEPIPGDSYVTLERAQEACCLLDNIFEIDVNNYCRGIYYDGSYTLIMGYIGRTKHTYDIHWSKDHEPAYVMEYTIGTQDNYQQITRSQIKNCTKLEEIFFTGKDICPHYDSDDCSRCEDQFTGKDCTIMCQKCLLGGSCVSKPTDETSSECQCSGLDGLWSYQCCPIGFKVTKMLDWSTKSQESINQIKITKTYDEFSSNELDAAYWCDPCPGITPSSWLNKDAYFDVCMGNGHCETNRFTMENQCQCDEPWAGISCMCHSDYSTPYVDENTPYGCGSGKRCIVTNEEFFIPDLIRTNWKTQTFGTECFGKPINGTNDVITDLKCVEYPNQPKNSEGLPYIEDYYMSFDNNEVFNTYRQMVFNKIMVIDRKNYADFGKKNNIYKNLYIDKTCSDPLQSNILNDTMWDQMVDECSVLCEQNGKCNYFSVMAYGGTCELYASCSASDKKLSYVFELEERDMRRKCTTRFPCHMGEGPCIDDSGCAGTLTCTTVGNKYFDKSKVFEDFGFCHHQDFTGITCVLDDIKKVTSDSLPFSGRMIYDVHTEEFHENIEFGRYTPIIMDANDRIIIQPETYKCPIGSYAVPGVFTDFGFGINATHFEELYAGRCNDIFIPSNGLPANDYGVGRGNSECTDYNSVALVIEATLSECADRCIEYKGFQYDSNNNGCRCMTISSLECEWYRWSERTGNYFYNYHSDMFEITDYLSTEEMLSCYNQCKQHGFEHIVWATSSSTNKRCWCTEVCSDPVFPSYYKTYKNVDDTENTNTFCAQCPHGQYSDGETFIEWQETEDNMRTSHCEYFYQSCEQCGGSFPNKTFFNDCDQCGPLVTFGQSEDCGGCVRRPVYTLIDSYYSKIIYCEGLNECAQYWNGESCPGNGAMTKYESPKYEQRYVGSLSYTETSDTDQFCKDDITWQGDNFEGNLLDVCRVICFGKSAEGFGLGYNYGHLGCYCAPRTFGLSRDCGGDENSYTFKELYKFDRYFEFVGYKRAVYCQPFTTTYEFVECDSCWHESGCKTCIGPDTSQPLVCNSCESCADTRWFKPPCTKCPSGKTSDIGSDSEEDCYTYPLNYIMQQDTLLKDQPDDTNYFLNRIFLERGGGVKYPLENYFRLTSTDDQETDWVHCFDLDETHEWCEESETTQRLLEYTQGYDETTECSVCGVNYEPVQTSYASYEGCQSFKTTTYNNRYNVGNRIFWDSAVPYSGLQCGNEKEVDMYENHYGYGGYCGFDLFPTIASNSFQNTLISNWNSYPDNLQYTNYNPFLAQCRGKYLSSSPSIWQNFDTVSNFIDYDIHQYDSTFAGTCGTYEVTKYGAECYAFLLGIRSVRDHSIVIDDYSQFPGGLDNTPYTTSFNKSNNGNATCGITPLDSAVRIFQIPQYENFLNGYCPGQVSEIKGNINVEECFENCSSWTYFTYQSSECTCGNTRDKETCDDWVYDDTVQSYRILNCTPGLYHSGVCTDPDAYPLSDVIEATTLQECADNCLADHIAWNGTNCKCYPFAHKYVVTDILDLKTIYDCSIWEYSDYDTYEAIDRQKCSIGGPIVEYKTNTSDEYIRRTNKTGIRGNYSNNEIAGRIDLNECKMYAQDNGYSFQYTRNGPFGCSKVGNSVYWTDADVIQIADGYCLDDWAYPETGIQAGSAFVINDLLDIRNCHDLCLTHDYKLIAIKGDFSVTQTCICVKAPCDNMYQFTPSAPAYTYRMLELKDPVDLFDGYCTNEMSLPNGDYMMTESIVDIKECLKACPKNAFVYDSGPNEGKCLCVGDICDDNMTATDEGRTYELLTMRQPEVLFDGYCRRHGGHVGTIDPDSPHDIWKWVERCSRTEFPAAMVHNTNGNVYCVHDFTCTEYYQYSTNDHKTYGLTEVQFAAPKCTWGCDILKKENDGYCVDNFHATLTECKQYASTNSLTFQFTNDITHSHGCSEINGKVYWRDLDMKMDQYGYCNNNAQFQTNINTSNVLEYRLCHEGCLTHGYDHIAVSTSGECKCVESCAPTTVDYAWATYSPIEDRSIPENIGIKSLITSSTSGVCDTQLQISKTDCSNWANHKGYTFSDTASATYNFGCTYHQNNVYFKDERNGNDYFVSNLGVCGNYYSHTYTSLASWKKTTWQSHGGGRCSKDSSYKGIMSGQACADQCWRYPVFLDQKDYGYNRCLCQTYLTQSECEAAGGTYYTKTSDGLVTWSQKRFFKKNLFTLSDFSISEKYRCLDHCLQGGFASFALSDGREDSVEFILMPLRTCFCTESKFSPCSLTVNDVHTSYDMTLPAPVPYPSGAYNVDRAVTEAVQISSSKLIFDIAYCSKFCQSRGYDRVAYDNGTTHLLHTCYCVNSGNCGGNLVYEGSAYVVDTNLITPPYNPMDGDKEITCGGTTAQCVDKISVDANTIDLNDYNDIKHLSSSCTHFVYKPNGNYACTTVETCNSAIFDTGTTYKLEPKAKEFEFNSSQQVIHDKYEKYYTLWYNDPDNGWVLRNVTGDDILTGGMENWHLPCVKHTEFYDTSFDKGYSWKYYLFGDDSLGNQEYCEGYFEPSTSLRWENIWDYTYQNQYIYYTDDFGGQSRSVAQYNSEYGAHYVWETNVPSVCTDNPWIEETAPGQRRYQYIKKTYQYTDYGGRRRHSYYPLETVGYNDVQVRRGDPNQPGRCKPSNAFFQKIFKRTSDLKGCNEASYVKQVQTVYPEDVQCSKTYTNVCERQMGCRNCVNEGILEQSLIFQNVKSVSSNGKCTKCTGQPRYGEGCDVLISRDYTYEPEDCQPHYFVRGVQYEYSGNPSITFDARDCEKLAANIGKQFNTNYVNAAPRGCYYKEQQLYHAPDFTFQTSGFPDVEYNFEQCYNYSRDNNLDFTNTDSNSVPFGCSQWEGAVFFKIYNESLPSIECGVPFSNSTVNCVIDRIHECSFEYGCVVKESIGDYRYIYNQIPSLEFMLNSSECFSFAASIEKEFQIENTTSRPRGCYTNLGFVMYNINLDSTIQTSYNDNYVARKAMKNWELYHIGIEKNGYNDF